MKKGALCLFLTCAAAFGQDSSSGNAAADALKKRMQGMDLLNLTKQPERIVLAPPISAAPKVCSIPLVSVIPPGTLDAMRVIKPRNRGLNGDIVQVPAPACAVFTK